MKLTYFIVTLLLFISCSNEQLSYEYEKVDQFLNQFEGQRPGYALGIVRDGKLIYSNGYGLANLDYNIPISDSTAFYIGSMAKQFTTAALLILEAEDKIDFDAPVTKYLSDFPRYKQEITINHLIHHVSGIRETNSLQLFQGIDRNFEEPFTTSDLIRLVVKQKELNFLPGEEYRYSSGGYAVLAKIVEQISGQTFRDFAKTNIFDPLNMTRTIVSDDHNEIIENRAVSYWPISKDKYERRSQVFDAYGDGGIITTVRDLANWDKAFYSNLLGVGNFAGKMYQKFRINNGDIIDYTRGLNVWDYKGEKVVQHNGGMLGFRVDMVRFPDHETSIILLGNSANLDPTGDALKIAEIIMNGSFEDEKPLYFEKETTKMAVTADYLSEFLGYYWTDQTNYFRRITMQNDSLFLDSGNPDYKQYLTPLSPKEFIIQGSNPSTHLRFDIDGADLLINFGNLKRSFRKFDPSPPKNLNEIMSYIGVYNSDELESTYKIFRENDTVFLEINKNKPRQIFPLPKYSEMVWNGNKMLWIGFAEIKFDFDENGIVNGFTIGDGRVSGVKFEKQSKTKVMRQ